MRRAAAARRAIALVLALSAAGAAFSQPAATAASGSKPANSVPANASVLPSGLREEPGESPLRRFEIIAFGAFPIILFYVGVGFDTAKYLSNGFDSRYLPWPFKGANSILPEEGEYLARIGVAAIASLGFSGADAWIRAVRHRKAAESQAAALAGSSPGSRSDGEPPAKVELPANGEPPPSAEPQAQGRELDSAESPD